MDEKSTTDAADNQSDQQNADNQTDQGKATTDNQNTDKGENLDTSKSTDTSDDDDKSTDGAEDNDASATKFDSDLDEWADKTGRPKPTSDRERELYQEIRNGQREYSRSKQAKETSDEVNKAIQDAKPADTKQDDEDDDDRDPVEKRQDELEAKLAESESLRMRSEFFTEKSVSAEESKVMGEILKEKVDKGGQAAFDYWTNPAQLDDWHTLAKARISTSTSSTTAIEQEAARKERERIAKEQQANGASRNAKTSVSKEKGGYNRTEYLKSDDY